MKRMNGAPRVRIFHGWAGRAGWVLCAAASWYWALAKGGQAAWFVASATGFLLLYALTVWMTGLPKPVIRRTVSHDRIEAGGTVRVHIELRREKGWFPFVWIHVGDELQAADGTIVFAHQKLLYAGMKTRIAYEYEIGRLRRGVYAFGAAAIAMAEPLGIAGKRWKPEGTAGRRLTVYPQPLEDAAAQLSRRESVSGAAIMAAMTAESSLVGSVRDYAHGDPLQRIHWKSTARTGGLKTKELDALAGRRVTVVIDDAAAAYGSGRMGRSRFETAASAACAVVRDAKQHGLAVELRCGAAASGAADEAPGEAERRALDRLAAAEPRGGEPLAAVLRKRAAGRAAAGRAAADAPLVLITPQLDAALLDCIGMLRARRVQVSLIYIGDTETLAPQAELLLRQLELMRCPARAVAVAAGRGSTMQTPEGGVGVVGA